MWCEKLEIAGYNSWHLFTLGLAVFRLGCTLNPVQRPLGTFGNKQLLFLTIPNIDITPSEVSMTVSSTSSFEGFRAGLSRESEAKLNRQ